MLKREWWLGRRPFTERRRHTLGQYAVASMYAVCPCPRNGTTVMPGCRPQSADGSREVFTSGVVEPLGGGRDHRGLRERRSRITNWLLRHVVTGGGLAPRRVRLDWLRQRQWVVRRNGHVALACW